MTQAIIDTGNPVNGFEFYGPFSSDAQAAAHGNLDPHLPTTWHIAPLHPPKADDAPGDHRKLADPGCTSFQVMECLIADVEKNYGKGAPGLKDAWPELFNTYETATIVMPLYQPGAYIVTVTQLVSDSLLDHDDRNDNPAGIYRLEDCRDFEHALDWFHALPPIGCRDDFDVAVVPIGECDLPWHQISVQSPLRDKIWVRWPSGLARLVTVTRGQTILHWAAQGAIESRHLSSEDFKFHSDRGLKGGGSATEEGNSLTTEKRAAGAGNVACMTLAETIADAVLISQSAAGKSGLSATQKAILDNVWQLRLALRETVRMQVASIRALHTKLSEIIASPKPAMADGVSAKPPSIAIRYRPMKP